MFIEIRSSWKIRGLNPVFVCWQGDAGKRGTWAFLPKDALLSPAPNSVCFFPKLLLALLPYSVSWWDALCARHSSFLLVSLCRWDAEGADMVRAGPLPQSVWPCCFLPIQHFFGGCQGFEGSHGLKVVTLLLDDLLGYPFLMWQNQVERCFCFSMLKPLLNFGRWQELKRVMWSKWCPVQKISNKWRFLSWEDQLMF